MTRLPLTSSAALEAVGREFADVMAAGMNAGCVRITVKIELEGSELVLVADARGFWITTPREAAPRLQ